MFKTMQTIFKVAIIIILLINGTKQTQAQTYNNLLAQTAEGIDITERLPSLAELQALAEENSPYYKMLDAEVRKGHSLVKEEQREWMYWVGIEGNAKYGLFDNLIIKEDLGLEESNTETTEQTRYSIGAFMKIPLSSLLDNSNIKTAKAEEEEILIHQREVKRREFRQLIITRYYDVVKENRGIIIKNNTVETFKVQCMRAKEDFENADITIDEYAKLEAMLAKATLSLEEAKLDFIAAYKKLEETIGVKITLKN